MMGKLQPESPIFDGKKPMGFRFSDFPNKTNPVTSTVSGMLMFTKACHMQHHATVQWAVQALTRAILP
jgi:hypothetical protein